MSKNYNQLHPDKKAEIREEAFEMVKQTKKSNMEIARILSAKHDCNINESWIRKNIRAKIKDLGEKIEDTAEQIDEAMEKADEPKKGKIKMALDALVTAHYNPETDQYLAINQNDGLTKTYIREREFLDKMMGLFANKNPNMTEDEVMYEVGISGHERNCRRTKLHIRKNWPNCTPETMRRMETDEQVEEYNEQRMEYAHIEKTKKARWKIKDKMGKKGVEFMYNFQQQLDEVKDALAESDVDYPAPVELEPFTPSDTYFLLAGDSHIGGRDLEKCNQVLRGIAQDAIDRPEKNIVVFRKWDSFECAVAGGMHAWQTEEMAMAQNTDNPIFWPNLVIYSADVIYEHFLKPMTDAGKQVKFIADAGNHGRGTKKQESDMVSGYELMMYALIEAKLAGLQAKIEYAAKAINAQEIAGINWINFHGHGQTGKANNAQIVNMYWKQGMPNYIVRGHRHQARQQNESQVKNVDAIHNWTNYTAITTPAITPANKYALEQVVAKSMRGYVTVERTRNGLKNGFTLFE